MTTIQPTFSSTLAPPHARLPRWLAVALALALGVVGCGGDDDDASTIADASTGVATQGESSDTAGGRQSSSVGETDASSGAAGTGDAESGSDSANDQGELRIEILDPLDGASLMAVPLPDLPGFNAADYNVRAALRGEGNDAITTLVAQSSGPLPLYYYADLVEESEGRVATFTAMRIGGITADGDPPTQFGIRVTPDMSATPPPADIVVTVVSPP